VIETTFEAAVGKLIAVLLIVMAASLPAEQPLHFKSIQRHKSAALILADTKAISYSLACEWKDEDDVGTRVICLNFRSGHDYVPTIRSGDFFVFDDPEGSKDDEGHSYAVVVHIISESEK
jgi:hypothetical protein